MWLVKLFCCYTGCFSFCATHKSLSQSREPPHNKPLSFLADCTFLCRMSYLFLSQRHWADNTQVGQQAALWKALSQILFPSSNHRNLPITNLYAKKNPKPAACELLIISTVWLITYCVEAINRQWESLNELESLGSPSVPGGEMAPYSGSPFSVWRGEAAQAPHVLGCGRGQASPHPQGSFLPKGAPGVDCLNPTPLLLPTPPRLLTLLQLQSGKTVLVDTRNWSL